MSTGAVTVRLNLNAGGYSADMAKAERQMRSLAKAGEDFSHGTVSQMQAASASIRVLEGGLTGNVRAAERFISMLPGVGAALQAAFPVVGAIALIGVLVHVGEEITKVVSKLKDIPENPFAGMIASSKLSNDALAITNDRLQLEINKLEHKPQNRMALALDQMRESSDKLFESLDKSNAAFDQAMGKGGVNRAQGLFRDETPTKDADAAIKAARAGVLAVNADYSTTIQDAQDSGDPANIKQARESWMKALEKAYAVQDAALQSGLDKAQAASKDFHGAYSAGSDPRAVIQRYQSALTVSAQDQASVGGQYGNSLMSGQRDTDQDAADQGELAKEAARKRLQAMEDELQQRKAQYGMSIAEERSYWQSRESAFKSGSDAYREVVNKVAGMEIQMQRQQAESLKAARAEQASGSRETLRVLESASAAVSAMMKRQADDVLHTGERWKAYNEAVAKASEIEAANAAAFDKARISIELASGQISKLDAAQQIAAVHTREFSNDLATLQKEREQITGDDSLSDEQRSLALKQNSNAQSVLQGRYSVQSADDNSAISDQTPEGATRKALDTMTQQWGDMTQGIISVMTKAADSLNDDIAKAITGHGSKADFGKTLTDAGQGLVKAGLQKTESSVMSAFGLGKPDGTQNNPIFTKDAGSGPGGVLGGGGSQGGGQGGGSIWSKLLHSVFHGGSQSNGGATGGGGGEDDDDGGGFDDLFQGAFAKGGNFVANRSMLVGEKGPELITPRHAGRVIPNHQINSGGNTYHQYSIDARGSNDPAATEAAVRRGIQQSVVGAMHAQHDSARRMPSGR